MPMLSVALRRAARAVLTRRGGAGPGARRWTADPTVAAAAGSRWLCSAHEAVEDGERAAPSGVGSDDALGGVGARSLEFDASDGPEATADPRVERLEDDDASDRVSTSYSADSPYSADLADGAFRRASRDAFGRRRRGRTKMVIVGEAEARARRRAEPRKDEDPGMDGIRVALAAMEARRRQLRGALGFDETAARGWFDPDDPEANREARSLERRQRNNEILAVDNEVRRYKEGQAATSLRGDGPSLPIGRRLLQGFFEPLSRAIALEQEAVRLKVPSVDRNNYGPFLLMLNPDKLAVITLHVVIGQLMKGEESFSPDAPQAGMCKFVRVVERLGEAVQAEVNLARLRQRSRVQQQQQRGLNGFEFGAAEERSSARDLAEDVTDVEDFIAKPHLADRFARVNAKSLRDLTSVRSVARFARSALNDSDWGSTARSKVGAALTNLLLNTARVKVPGPNQSARESAGDGSDGGFADLLEVPAFYHDYTFHKGQKYGTISWHEAFYGFMDDEHMIRATLSPVRYMPMVTPPRPWTRFNAGGYLRSESIVMRGHYSLHGPSKKQMLALHAAQSGAEVSGAAPAFQPVLDALNVLGKTAWVINDPVLRVMEEVWARGGGKAGVPPRANVPDPAWPRAPYGLRFGASRAQMLASSIPTREDVSGFIKDLNRAKQTNRELHSQRCDFLIKLQVAKDMRAEKRIYFPHNIDFRGRAYTMHVHLNHLGSDVCRGALMFAEERPLGPDGLKWLCVQAANLYGGGVDKLPMDERAQWIADRFDVVRAVARDPLSDEGSFWLDAEDPWQCLATCFEIDKAIASGNPETYMCRLPVHQDGSCNGLQHYAALGRDEAGGEQVNLMPRDRPGDVYTGIANVLRKIVADDEQNAEDLETRKLASLLAPHVDRKLVKQTVMTSVYGVTHVGARQQIQNRLKERGAVDDENVRYRVATYAASRTLDALSNLFVNARDVMAWLAECARLVAGRGKAVEWTTPMGLPVVQPYRAKGRKVIRTLVQSFVLQFDNDENKVQKNKQRSAFPPNYIHSVDSAHMMKTAVACHAAGLTFAGVHDSFWTHAGDVPEMSKHIREKFIELHSEPLLEQLYEELKQKYPEIAMELPPPPPPGSMDLQSVRDSVYFFS